VTAFKSDIEQVRSFIARVRPGGKDDIYALPWYLVVGEPETGKSAAVKAIGLTFPHGEPARSQNLTCWIAGEAVVLEPSAHVIGPRRNASLVTELCQDLKLARTREAIDGILLVIRVSDFADTEDDGLDGVAKRFRDVLLEIGRALDADVPCYVVMTGYDTLWGFEDVFQWGPDRQREDPWGFTLPAQTNSQEAVPRIHEELASLGARLESMCFARMAEENLPLDSRMRVYQHLCETRVFIEKLKGFFKVLAAANAYERAPWIRSMGIGAAVPGMGLKPRAGTKRFLAMGLQLPPASMRGQRPGGLPLHGYMKTTILPETEIVPLAKRWRDDKLFVAFVIIGILLWLASMITVSVVVAKHSQAALSVPAPLIG
jgi:type VI protein secretion system component VasK